MRGASLASFRGAKPDGRRQAGLEPASRRSRHRALRARHERAPWRAPGDQALLQRDAVRALSARGRGLPRLAPNRCRATRTARRGPCARRSPSSTGSIPARIVCGAGSDELLNLIASAYLGPGDEAIYSEHGFLVYKIAILGRGATPVVAPETDLTSNVDAILACVSDRTRLVFIANPNNPTGTYLAFDEVKRLRAGLPDDCAARARRGLRRICAQERLRGRHRAGRHHAQHGDDAHLLQDLRARLAAHRLGLLPDRDRRRAEPHPGPVQRLGPGDRGRRRRARRPGLGAARRRA